MAENQNFGFRERMRMFRRICGFLTLAFIAITVGCQTQSETSTAKNNIAVSGPASEKLDFDALLLAVDGAIGKRFQSMQMEAMNSATYNYDGPIQAVVDIVGPLAAKAGFTEETQGPTDGMSVAEKEMQEKMGIDMKSLEQKMWTHPNGDALLVARMDMSSKEMDMKMLTVQIMNPKKMSQFGAVPKNQ